MLASLHLQTVQGHSKGRWGGGSRSIYQDVLLYFFYPSQRRWFYFSENPLNSDQVRWLLSLETQELSHHNRYKWWTLKCGSGGLLMVFSAGSFSCCFSSQTKNQATWVTSHFEANTVWLHTKTSTSASWTVWGGCFPTNCITGEEGGKRESKLIF